MSRIVALAAVLLAVLPAGADAESNGQARRQLPAIALIIDDLGYRRSAGRRAVNLPGPVACAVLPHTPHGQALALQANALGKEVLLHLPLQPEAASWSPDPGAIALDTTRRQFIRILEDNLESVPFAVGINNHMGSLLTRHPGHMAWLMEAMQARPQMFFVDSRTTPDSVAQQLAREYRVPSVRRDVFLDRDPDAAAVAAEFERLKRLALRQGYAVGIGHPFPDTLALLEQQLPMLEAEGFRLVGLRRLIGIAREGAEPRRRAVAVARSLQE